MTLFVIFNDDHRRPECYRGPSMSVGNVVEIQGMCFAATSNGFERLETTAERDRHKRSTLDSFRGVSGGTEMKITVKSVLDIHVASRLAEQIRPLNVLMTRVYGMRSEIRSMAFESATLLGGYNEHDSPESAYYWQLAIVADTWDNGIYAQVSHEVAPDDGTSVSDYLASVLSWMYRMTAVEPALGQEFGMTQPWIVIEEI